ncbi:MAG: S-layer homology domain-containing protein, partial [Chloroflexota bacterium]|nr:S-layer homology domain-containing protein [Chloroflexota bacterium]
KGSVGALLVGLFALGLLWFGSPVGAEQTVPQAPEATCPAGGQCFADVPPGSPFYDYANNLYMQDIISGYPCGGADEPCDDQNRPYYRPGNSVTRAQMTKFVDLARKQPGIHIDTATAYEPLYSRTTAAFGIAITGDGGGTGVYGTSINGYGVHGTSTYNYGVYGETTSPYAALRGETVDGIGVQGSSETSDGVYGSSISGRGVTGISSSSYGVIGASTSSYAGYFQGNVHVNGTLSKTAGSFKIDHPLDPANKYLSHSFVESPDMMNVYNGNVTTDARGEAVIILPDYFDTLNRDFRYQLTILGNQFAQARVSEEITNNRFKIMTDKPNIKVSWQVTGIRQDPYANRHRIPVEEDKPKDERGLYLQPELYGQPQSKQIGRIDVPPAPNTESGAQP